MLSLEQKNKITDLLLGVMAFVFVCELLFSFDTITNALITFVNNSGVYGWITIAVLQFVQVVFIPVPAYFITLTSIKMDPNDLLLLYGVTLLCTILGVVTAYFIGYKWGKKAVTWAAGSESEYDRWSKFLKSKKTNIIYLLTVLLPIFPDDIMCLVAGSIRMNFWWFFFCNLLGRAIGLVTFMFVFTSVGGSTFSLILFGIILALLLIYKIILIARKRELKRKQHMNLIIIGNNTDDVAMDIWKANTNYVVLNMSPVVQDKMFLKFIDGKEVIVSTTSIQFEHTNVNDFVDYMQKNRFIPIFISDDQDSLERKMYTAVCELLPNSVLYTKNKAKKDYDELLRICRDYVLGKGIIENDNKTLRTPRKRKKPTTKE